VVSELVVTPRKLRESPFETPVAVSVLTRERMERLQVRDLKDVAALTPGLVIGDGYMSNGAEVALRGVGRTTFTPAVDQSVLLEMDGLQLSQGLAYGAATFDLGQIEVLRGPQGLFFGKSATGGVISVRSADPTDRVEAIVRGGREFEARQWRGELVLSGPLTDRIKVRLAALYTREGGYFANAATALAASGARDPVSRRLFPARGLQARATVLWSPSSQVSARLKLNRTHDRSLYADSLQYVSCPDGTRPLLGVPFLGGEDCRLDRTSRSVGYDPAAFPGVENDGVPYHRRDQTYGSLEVVYDAHGGLVLTSTSAFYRLRAAGLPNSGLTTSAAPVFAGSAHLRNRVASEELRLTSRFAGTLNFTLGAAYEQGGMQVRVVRIGNTRYGVPAQLESGSNRLDREIYSLYGQGRWKLTRQIEAAFGARWDSERQHDRILGQRTAPLPRDRISARRLSPEATLTYRVSAEVIAFAALKRGYKSGSFDILTVTAVAPGEDIAFDDERAQGGETGLKGRLLDHRLAFDLGAYDYRYKNLQVDVTVPGDRGLPTVRTLNAGAARVYGVEFDVTYRPAAAEGLELHVTGDWSHARFVRFENAPCYGGQTIADGCDRALDPATGLFTAQDLSGRPLSHARDWQVNFGFDYRRQLPDGLALSVSNLNRYVSGYAPNLSYPYRQGAAIKTDLTLALEGADGRWEAAFIGKNLGGKLTVADCANFSAEDQGFGGQITGGVGRGPAGVDELACWVDRGREVWLRLSYRSR
jgi:iron complex outermembrane receptor protein